MARRSQPARASICSLERDEAPIHDLHATTPDGALDAAHEVHVLVVINGLVPSRLAGLAVGESRVYLHELAALLPGRGWIKRVSQAALGR
jgi:hypothetical protein